MSGICMLKRFLRKEGIFFSFKEELRGRAGRMTWQNIAYLAKNPENLRNIIDSAFIWARLSKFRGGIMNNKWNAYLLKHLNK